MLRGMIYDEFQRQVGKAGLTLKEFASLLRMNRTSLSNLAKKHEVPAHLAVIATLMGEMADNGIDFRRALSRIDITPKKPRGGGAKGKFGGVKQSDIFGEAGRDDGTDAVIPPPAREGVRKASVRRK
jgi:hypothetical protein